MAFKCFKWIVYVWLAGLQGIWNFSTSNNETTITKTSPKITTIRTNSGPTTPEATTTTRTSSGMINGSTTSKATDPRTRTEKPTIIRTSSGRITGRPTSKTTKTTGRTTTTSQQQSMNRRMYLAYIGGPALVFLFAAGLTCVMVVRRGYLRAGDNKNDRPRRRKRPSKLGSAKNPSNMTEQQRETSRPVKVTAFAAHMKKMSADSNLKFADEFEDLGQSGQNQAFSVAQLPTNGYKNRFPTILPYDEFRVILTPAPSSSSYDGNPEYIEANPDYISVEGNADYINASYLPGYNSDREYIVTQGPLSSTRNDFWRMIWQQNCKIIVMLTKCVEGNREKCDHYWPVDPEAKYYGEVKVLILKKTKCPDWNITQMQVSVGDKTRKVTHFKYKAWPDFDVPKTHQSVVKFVRLVRSKVPTKECGPIVVHCSAGVGRSGAFVALDQLLQQLRDKHNSVDIFGLVYDMRKYRMKLVLAEQQYICVHECILCVIEGTEDISTNTLGQENYSFERDTMKGYAGHR